MAEPLRFPEHKAGLMLEHNDHLNVYQTAAEWIAECADREWDHTWESDEAKARAAATNEVWTLRWYPITPIGFQSVAAPTLDEVLKLALAVEAGEREAARG